MIKYSRGGIVPLLVRTGDPPLVPSLYIPHNVLVRTFIYRRPYVVSSLYNNAITTVFSFSSCACSNSHTGEIRSVVARDAGDLTAIIEHDGNIYVSSTAGVFRGFAMTFTGNWSS